MNIIGYGVGNSGGGGGGGGGGVSNGSGRCDSGRYRCDPCGSAGCRGNRRSFCSFFVHFYIPGDVVVESSREFIVIYSEFLIGSNN